MPSFPAFQFDKANVKVRFLEPTSSQALNQRFVGLPRGVYVGYRPIVTAGSLVLTLGKDQQIGFSTLKVGAASTAMQIDVFTGEDVQLDFTGHAQFPVYVIARADYAADTPTQGRILTRATGPSGPQEIALCLVNKIGADLAVSTTVPIERQGPLAFSGQAFGYMYPGANDDIVFAQSATAEVVYARQSLKVPGPPPPARRLADRLALDLAADYLADLTGLRTVTVTGNVQIVLVGASSVNVSSSFGALTRQALPAVTIPETGTEAAEGAITAPTDADRNVCFVTNETTAERVVAADESPIYGRLAFVGGAIPGAIPGTLAFTNASTVVVGAGFPGVLQVGDLILGADGKFYAVASFTNPTHLVITPAYQGPTAAGFASHFRRYTLSLLSRGTGAEVAATLPTTTNLRFFFPGWFRTDRSVFDATALMKKGGERPVEKVATNTLKGRALVAIGGAKAGALYQVSSNQTPIAGTNFHTLNFTALNAAVSTSAGQANVTLQGNPGPPGPGSAKGPTGLRGPNGPGLRSFNAGAFTSSTPPPGPIFGPGGSHTITVDFTSPSEGPAVATPLVHVCAGFARFAYSLPGFWTAPGAAWTITGISMASPFGTVFLTLGAGSTGKVFIGATS